MTTKDVPNEKHGPSLSDKWANFTSKGVLERKRRNHARKAVKIEEEEAYLEHIIIALNAGRGNLARALLGYLVTEIWRSLDPGDTMQRFRLLFLEHTYSLLTQCAGNQPHTEFILVTLQERLQDLPDKSYGDLSRTYCQHLLQLVQAQDEASIAAATKALREVSNNLGTPVLGIEGGKYAYDFYRRADVFFTGYGVSPLLALRARSYAESYFPKVFERSHELLDALRTEEQMLPAIYMHKYWGKVKARQKSTLENLSLPERQVCAQIIETIASHPGGYQRELGFSLDTRDYETFDLAITNIGGGTIEGIRITSDGFNSDRREIFNIAPWTSQSAMLIIENPLNQQTPLAVSITDDRGKTWSKSWNLALVAQPVPQEVKALLEIPLVDQRYSPNSSWAVARNELLEELKRPLTQSGGSVRIVCGIPRIGKTTLLEQFQEVIESEKLGIVFSLDLQLLLPRDGEQDKGISEERLRQLLRKTVKYSHLPQKNRDTLYNRMGDQHTILDLLNVFITELAACAKQTRLVILLDELSLLALRNSPLLKTFLEYLGPQLKAQLNHADLHVLLCGQEDLPYLSQNLFDYPLLSSVDPKPILVGNLNREQMQAVLEYPFYDQQNVRFHPDLWYDDLALDLIERYTGGHPLLLKLITRTATELIKAERISVPVQGIAMYQLLEEKIEPVNNHNFGALADDLRYALNRAGQLIFDNLTPYIHKRLDNVLNWRTMDSVSELRRLGLLRLTDEGTPRMGIGVLKDILRKA